MNLRSLFPRSAALLILSAPFLLPAQTPSTPATPSVPPTGEWDEHPPSGPVDEPDAEQRSTGPTDEFAQIDTDRDGRISAVEYSASPRAAVERIAAGKETGQAGASGGFDLHNNEGRPDQSKFFRRLDINRDGYLSREELDAPPAK